MSKRGICRQFQATGRCKFGTKCKFLHGDNDNRPLEPPNPLRDWRLNLPRPGAQPRSLDLAKFFQTGLELVQSDYATMQDVVLGLASHGGLVRVTEVLEKHEKINMLSRGKYLQEELTPFFSMITHPNVKNSPLLEKPLVDIYNVIYGPHGLRTAGVFLFATNTLRSDTHSKATFRTCFETLFDALTQVVLRNGSANINTQLIPAAEYFVDKAIELSLGLQDASKDNIRKLADKLNRVLNMGKQIALTDQQTDKVKTSKAKFVKSQEPPGGRHDNDHSNIEIIKVLPTFGEISSKQPEYLPLHCQDRDGLASFEALIDRHFRLVREDTVGQLRDAIRASLQPQHGVQGNLGKGGPRVNTYDGVNLVDVVFLRGSGIELFVRINQPFHMKEAAKRKDRWERSKRLQNEALVCLTNVGEAHIFCVVSAQGRPTQAQVGNRLSPENPAQIARLQNYSSWNLYTRSDGAYLSLKPVSTSADDLLVLLTSSNWSAETKLVEFPGVLLPSFEPTLLGLQSMLRTHDTPFMDIITAKREDQVQLSVPAYARAAGFSFDLSCITRSGKQLTISPRKDFDLTPLTDQSTLDETQAEALIHCLRSSLALIQGPPGTGKSFTGISLIKVLLAAKKKANLGPIICVCYTNHALDQLLEHLHDHGVKQIVRVGSRSKSGVLENVNLRKIAREAEQSPAEKRMKWQLNQAFDDDVKQASALLDKLHKAHYTKFVGEHLQNNNMAHYHELFEDEALEEGWHQVRDKKSDPLMKWVNKGPATHQGIEARSVEELQTVKLNTMTRAERRALRESWVSEIRQTVLDHVLTVSESFHKNELEYKKVRGEIDLRCLQDADVVGLTTSGLARNLSILRSLRAKVLVCEEAGEVLEAHVLTALLPSLEHAILIGDHQQLRPQVQKYDLSRESPRGAKYSLDISLFERLVNDPSQTSPKVAYRTLETQRRMHPSISRLIRSTLYPALKDSPSVSAYPEVVGMKRRLFWLDHRNLENGSDKDHAGDTSHFNTFEVEMVTSLVNHLVRQGAYRPGEIAVLTPYLAQFFKLRSAFSNIMQVAVGERDVDDAVRQGYELEEEQVRGISSTTKKGTLDQALRIATVDNFQGEEAKVVVISLVRSNIDNRVGFLKTPNRINVLLSRAQHGMYIVGNAETASSVSMWSDVVEMLRQDGCLGESLALQCPRHLGTPLEVSAPEDFVTLSPEGGCGLMCDRRLSCGHACRTKCHSSMLHDLVHCLEPCPRSLKGCDHSCPKACGDPCVQKCGVVLAGQELSLACTHKLLDPACWQAQHPAKVVCVESVQKEVPICGHVIQTACHTDVTAENYRCQARCDAILECGHHCQRLCFVCRPDRKNGQPPEHGDCRQNCGRSFTTCSHTCLQLCHLGAPCPPCGKACNVACAHSKCDRTCSQPCAPCAQQACPSTCEHSQCSMPCAAPCDWLPCGERCPRILDCGHQCPSLCGELCPAAKFCQVCASDETKQQCADFLEFTSYGEIDLNENPCIFPQCGHIATVGSMDGMMSMADFYELADNKAVQLKDNDLDLTQKVPVCPSCRGSLRNINRYGRMVRQALLAEATKKFTIWSNARYVPLAQKVQDLQERLSNSTAEAGKQFTGLKPLVIKLSGASDKQIKHMEKSSQSPRYRELVSVHGSIMKYMHSVAVEEQPFTRVWELVQHKRRLYGTMAMALQLGSGVMQTGQYMKALSLLLRCHLAVLCDFVSQANVSSESTIDLAVNKAEAENLSRLAKQGFQPAIEVEAYLYYGRYCAAEQVFLKRAIKTMSVAGGSIVLDEALRKRIDELRSKGLDSIEQARATSQKHPGSAYRFAKEVEEVEKMINESTLHDVMLPAEMKAVFDAMSREFSGTGHWYRCINGHLFTIGECGMPMELARCPQCGAPIGGRGHRAVGGVTHARDLEEQMQRMRI